MIHVPGPRCSLVLITVVVSHLVTSSQSLTKPLAFSYIYFFQRTKLFILKQVASSHTCRISFHPWYFSNTQPLRWKLCWRHILIDLSPNRHALNPRVNRLTLRFLEPWVPVSTSRKLWALSPPPQIHTHVKPRCNFQGFMTPLFPRWLMKRETMFISSQAETGTIHYYTLLEHFPVILWKAMSLCFCSLE